MPDDLQSRTNEWSGARILEIRGRRVMLDSDLARLYGVATRALLQQVRRNAGRFPPEFGWRLRPDEAVGLSPHVVTSRPGRGGRRHGPWVFTEHGAVMLAHVIDSPAAVLASVEVVRAFLQLRALAAEHRDLVHRLDDLEQRRDVRSRVVFDAIRALLQDPRPRRGRVGFAGGMGDRDHEGGPLPIIG